MSRKMSLAKRSVRYPSYRVVGDRITGADARKKAHAIIRSGRKGTRPGERLTGVYWLEGGRFSF